MRDAGLKAARAAREQARAQKQADTAKRRQSNAEAAEQRKQELLVHTSYCASA